MTAIRKKLYWTSQGRMKNCRKQKEKFICAFRPQNRTKNVNNTVETSELVLNIKIVQNIAEIKHHAEQVQNSRCNLFPSSSYVQSMKTVTEEEICVVFGHTFTPTFQSLSKSKKTLKIRNKGGEKIKIGIIKILWW
jgi:hypothetical protein